MRTTEVTVNGEEEVSEDAYSIIAYWNWERQNYFVKNVD